MCPALASTSSTFRYTDDVSLPVKRYWPTNTSSPASTKWTKSGLFTGRNSLDAGTLTSVVRVTLLPCSSAKTFGARESKEETSWGASWTPISGPRVSSIVAQRILVCFIASLRLFSVRVWYSMLPHEKSKRAVVMPASSSATSSGTVRDFTPTVQITLVSALEEDGSSDSCVETARGEGRIQ